MYKKNIKITLFFERTNNLRGIVFLPIRYNNFVLKFEYDLIKKTTSNIYFHNWGCNHLMNLVSICCTSSSNY